MFERLEDRNLLSGDAWGGINALNGGEGESSPTDVVRYSLTVSDTTNVALPTNPDGSFAVTKGQTFRLHGSLQDVRNIEAGAGSTGVFAAYMNVAAANSNLIALRYGETQQLLFVPTTTNQVADTITGTFTLTFQGQTTQAINAEATIAPPLKSRAQLIQDALTALPNIGAGNVEVTKSLTNDNGFNIRFVNSWGERDVPPITGDFSSLTHLQSGGVTDNFYPADLSNPGTFAGSFAHVSPYINGPSPSADSPVPASGGFPLAEVGSFLQGFTVTQPGGEKEFFTVDIQAQLPGEVDFWGALPSTPTGHETLIFPSSGGGTKFTVDPQFIGFVQDSTTPLRLKITAAVVAGTSQFTVAEDSDTTALNVLANSQVIVSAGGVGNPVLDPNGLGRLSKPGAIQISAGKVNYAPAPNYNGTVTFTYTVNDQATPTPHSDTGTATITVTAVNDAPVAGNPSVSTGVGKPVAVNLTACDVEQDPLTFTVLTQPTHGMLSGTAPDLTYTPEAGYVGTDHFTFQANDGQADSNVATVTITVSETPPPWQNPVNPFDVDADGAVEPLDYVVLINAINDYGAGSSPLSLYLDVSGDGVLTPLDVLLVMNQLTTQGCSPPASVAERQDVAPGADVVAVFQLEVTDLAGNLLTQAEVGDAVQLRIYAVDNRPSFPGGVAAGFLDVRYDPALVSVAGAVQPGDHYTVVASGDTSLPGLIDEVGGGANSFSLPHKSLLATLPFTVAGTGVVTFQGGAADVVPCHDVLVFGSNAAVPLDMIQYGTASLTLSARNNHAPIAVDASASTGVGKPVAVNLTAYDADSDPLTFTVLTPPAHGTLSGTAPNLVYTPYAGYTGGDSFTFKANDGLVDSNVATVAISVAVSPTDVVRYGLTVTDTSNVALPDTNQDGIPDVTQGQTFRLHGTLQDVRSILGGTSTGVFAAYLDVLGTNTNLIALRYGETQQLLFVPTTTNQVADTITGTFTLTFQGQTTQAINARFTIDLDTGEVLKSRAQLIQDALAALPNIGAGNVEVTKSLTNDNAFNIRFVNRWGERDVPPMTGDFSSLTHLQTGVVVDDFYPAALSNPGSFAGSFAHVSPYINGPSPSADSPVLAPGGSPLAEVGSFLQGFSVTQPGGKKEFFTVDIQAQLPGEVDFWGALPSTLTGHETLIFPSSGGVGTKFTVDPQFIGFVQNSVSPLRLMINASVPERFTSTPPTKAFVDSLLTYDAQTTNEGQAGCSYSLVNAPTGAAIDAATGLLIWTPTAVQAGNQSFAIRLTDGAGNAVEQVLNIQVVQASVKLRLQPTDLSGNPISHVSLGSPFLLQVFAQDVRSSASSSGGVFAAYMNVAFDPTLVSPVGETLNDITFAPPYTNGKAGTFTSGAIHEVGAFAGTSPVGTVDQLMFSVTMTPVQVGTVNFTGSPATALVHEIVVWDQNTAVSPDLVNFVSGTLTIDSGVIAYDDTFHVDQHSSGNSLPVLTNDINHQGGTLTVFAVGATDHGGTVAIAPDNQHLLYTPAANFSGQEQFTYTLSNGQSTSTATVTVQVIDSSTDVVRYSLTVTDTSNVPLPDTNQDGIPDVTQGQTFRLHGTLQDVRSILGGISTGVFAAYMDVAAANSNRIALRYGETQQLLFDPTTTNQVADTITGIFTLTFQGQTTQAINAEHAFDANTGNVLRSRAQLIQDALAALPNIGAGNVEVTTSLTNDNAFNIHFVNGLGERDVPLMTGNYSALTHLQSGGVTDNFYPADISHPGTFGSSFAHVSPYINGPTPSVFLPVPAPGGSPLAEVGSFLDGFSVAQPAGQKEFFTVDIQAQVPGEVDFWGALPSTPAGHETIVFPSGGGNPLAVDPQFIGFVQDSASPLRVMITPPVTAPLVRIRLATTDLQGQPITHIAQGEAFLLEAYVQELATSTHPQPQGVYSAYFDVNYAAGLVSSLAQDVSDIAFSSLYTNGQSGSFATPGLIDEVGSFYTPQTPPGASERLQFSISMVALGIGQATFTADPADIFSHEVLVFDGPIVPVSPDALLFLSTQLMIDPPANHAPVATDDNYRTDEDTPLVIDATQGLLTNDSDAEGDPLQVTAVDVTGMHGQLTWSADGSFTYHPPLDFNGRDSFTYLAHDGLEHSNPATVTITVTPVNDAPVIQVPGALIVNEDTNLVMPGLQVNDVDAGASAIQVTLSASHGTISVAPLASMTGNGTGRVVLTGTLADINASLTGGLTYRGTADFNGADALVIAANDLGNSPPPARQVFATIPLTVQAVNDPPVARDDTYSTNEDTLLVVPASGVLANDTDVDLGTTLTVTAVDTSGLVGTLNWQSNGSFTFDPRGAFDFLPAGQTATGTAVYTISDGNGGTAHATVTVTIAGVNDPPVANNQTLETNYYTSKNITLTATDVDNIANSLTYTVVTPPAHGSLSGTAPHLTYMPTANYRGGDSFTFQANDGRANSQIAMVALTIGGVGPDSFEPNEAAETAADLGVIQGVRQEDSLTVHVPSDVDWFQFQTVATGNALSQVSVAFEQALGNLNLELYRQEPGSRVAVGTSVISVNGKQVSLAGLAAGTYLVHISGETGATCPDYTLRIEAPYALLIPPDAFEPNETWQTARNLQVVEGQIRWGGLTVHAAGNEDWYRFETRTVGDSQSAVSIEFQQLLGDLDLSVYRFNAATPDVLLVVSNSAGVGDGERVSLLRQPAGIFYVCVLGHGNATNPAYVLQLAAPVAALPPDRFEPNDSSATAADLGAIEGSRQESGLTVHLPGNADWYRFDTLAIGDRESSVAVTFDQLLGPLSLSVVRQEAGQLVAVGSAAAAGNEQRISLFGQPAGTYFVQVVGFDNATSPNYTLDILASFTAGIPADKYEPNDTRATATELSAFTGQLRLDDLTVHESGNADWFRFQSLETGSEGDGVTLNMLGAGDLDLQLYDANGNYLAGSFSVGDTEHVSLAKLPKGTYCIEVTGFAGATNSNYSLVIDPPQRSVQIPPDIAEPNDSRQAAYDLRLVEGQVSPLPPLTIHRPGDEDWFSFQTTSEASRTHFVRIDFPNAMGDLALALYDASGNPLRVSQGQADYEQINLGGLPAATYYLRAYGVADATNPKYTLSFWAPEHNAGLLPDRFESNDSLATAYNFRQLTQSLTEANLTIHSSIDQDWFEFTTTATGQAGHNVRIQFQHALGDLDLFLWNAQQAKPLASSQGTSDGEQVSLAGLPAGTYYAQVVGYGGATSPDYTLTVEPPVTLPLLPDRFEPNATPQAATVLRSDASGQVLTGSQILQDLTIHGPDDSDYYCFTTAGTGLLGNGVSLLSQSANGALGMELLDAQGKLLAVANGPVDVEHISFANLLAGTYYLRVFGMAGATNRYDLSLDVPRSADPAGDVGDWTVLVYMTASDLTEAAFDDVNELEVAAASLPGSVKLALLWDQSSKFPTYPTGGGTQSAWGTTGRALVVGDTDPTRIATTFEILPEQNTGDPATLQNFLHWAKTVAPARNYALIMWDHGSGLGGFNFDNADLQQTPDNLTTIEFAGVLQQSDPHIQLVAFDACLMGTAEVGYSIRNLTDVLVASQEVVAAAGYDYTTVFEPLYVHPESVGAEELGTALVRSFEQQYGNTSSTSDTLSAMRTGGYDALAAALNVLVTATDSATSSDLTLLRVARNSATHYAYSYLRDLGSFLARIQDEPLLSAGLRQAATGALGALAGLVVAQTADELSSSGASIFLPRDGRDVSSYTVAYAAFEAATHWSRFLNRLGVSGPPESGIGGGRGLLTEDWAEPNDVPAEAFDLHRVGGAGNLYQSLNLQSAADTDWFRFTLDAAAGTADRVLVTPSAGAPALTLEVCDPLGTSVLRTVTGTGPQSLNLSGLAAGVYLIHVDSNAEVPSYTLTIDAPVAGEIADWAGNNATSNKAYPLGLIDNQALFSGLGLAVGMEDWFTFATPRLAEVLQFGLTISVGQGGVFTAELRKEHGSLVGTATGSGTLFLPFTPSGAGENYTLHITNGSNQGGASGEPAGSIGYNLLFQTLDNYWHNAVAPCDVSNDGEIVPLDVLIVINYLNSHPDVALPAPDVGTRQPSYDVNNDGMCTPTDVLTVINYLNGSRIASEGEASFVTAVTLPVAQVQAILILEAAAVDASHLSRVSQDLAAAKPRVLDRGAALVSPPSPVPGFASGTPDRETGLTVRSLRRVSDEQVATSLESAVLNLDDVLQDIAPDIAKRWQSLPSPYQER